MKLLELDHAKERWYWHRSARKHAVAELEKALAREVKLREVLEFYADADCYVDVPLGVTPTTLANVDAGMRARDVLEDVPAPRVIPGVSRGLRG